MLTREYVESLVCPYCRSRLELAQPVAPTHSELHHGIVRCSCYEYPVVDGIVVLRQLSGPADTVDPATEHVRRGDIAAARAFLERAGSMAPDDARSRAVRVRSTVREAARSARRRLAGARPAHDATDDPPILGALHDGRPTGFADYLYQRYANPSFLAAIPTMALIDATAEGDRERSSPAVLDLACGIGHSTAMIGALYPEASIVAADPDFVNLVLLRRHFNPAATCVCIDAELPLPFTDDAFDALFCLDAFHYIRSKWALCRELDRVIRERGVWIMPHLHNADVSNISPGIPLSPADYLRVLGEVPAVLVDESALLRGFTDHKILDLTDAPDVAELAATPNMTMCASRRAPMARTHDLRPRFEALARGGVLGTNPIYRAEADEARVRLVMDWPSAALEQECSAVVEFLPREVSIPVELWRALGTDLCADHTDALVELLMRFVIMPLPPGYRVGPELPKR